MGQVAGLGAFVLTCLAAVAFLLGRESARTAAVPSPGPAAASAPGPLGTLSAGASTELSPVYSSPPAGGLTAIGALPAPSVAPASSGDPGQKEAVARYFAEIESIEAEAKGWSDPMALANTILKRASEGDTSGFDDLLSSQRRVRDRINAMTVPAACQEHHRRTLEALGEATTLLETMRNVMSQGGSADLSSLVSAGRSLEGNAREVDALAAEVKRQFGLAP